MATGALRGSAPEIEARCPEARRPGLLSARAPCWVPRPVATHRDANRSPQRALHESGRIFRPAFSSADNRSRREPGWPVVDMPVAEFDARAHRFGQWATLWRAAGTAVRMRPDAAPPAELGSHQHIDPPRR